MDFVKWDGDIPNIWENKVHVPNHQPTEVGRLQSMGVPEGVLGSSTQAKVESHTHRHTDTHTHRHTHTEAFSSQTDRQK